MTLALRCLLGIISARLQFPASAQGADSSVVLVQGAMRVHNLAETSEEWHDGKGAFLVDNRRLKHKGPGLVWRLSKDVNDTAGKDLYAAWGTVVNGYDSGDGWIQVGDLYLPTRMHDVPVVIRQDLSTDSKKLRVRYELTELKAQDGSWVPCNITRMGSKPGLYDVLVIPTSFASYNLTDVPASQLKNVERVRVFVPAPAPRAPKPAPWAPKPAPPAPQKRGASGVFSLQVVDLQGSVMNLKVLEKSPLRTVMKVACERVQMSWDQCQQSVRFTHRGAEVNEARHSWEVGLKDGEIIKMEKA